MKLFISTSFIPDGRPLYEALELCTKAGINSVEIGSNHCYESNYDYITNSKFQYLIHNYFPIPKKSFVVNIASIDDDIRGKSIMHIKGAIDLCREIGAKLYTFHPGFLTDPRGSNLSNKNYDFQWDENQLKNTVQAKAKYLMYRSLDEVVEYAKSVKISIAIETEGSLSKKAHLLMQRPEEYEEFFKRYSSEDIGINLNLGHLNLAVKAFKFKISDFINLIQPYLLAMELSHNDGLEDQHLPLQPNGWYWDLIHDARFENTYKILEFRNTPMSIIVDNIKMINEKAHTV